MFAGVAEIAGRCRPRLVILNAGAAQTRGAFHLTMDANDAIETAVVFPQTKVVGVHNEGWAHFKEGAEALARAFAALGLAERYVGLTPGESKVLSFEAKE